MRGFIRAMKEEEDVELRVRIRERVRVRIINKRKIYDH
jgi:hypothetical protein